MVEPNSQMMGLKLRWAFFFYSISSCVSASDGLFTFGILVIYLHQFNSIGVNQSSLLPLSISGTFSIGGSSGGDTA
ncbi:hypothetical protein CHUAL_012874 [Chamberlinius hualienensis]